MTKQIRTGIAAALGIMLLILDAKTAVLGAREGLNLCLGTVIPSLLPFFVLSILLTNSLTGRQIPLLQPITRLTGIPKGCESILLIGLLGGYPVGAQCVTQAWRCGQLSRKDAHRMLGFCSNAGPSFLFGILSVQFPNFTTLWLLWGIHILSALITGCILPGKSHTQTSVPEAKPIGFAEALERSLKIMAGVCGWVILFRVLITVLDRWAFWMFPLPVRTAIHGILELTNGCCDLETIPTIGQRFIICSGILAFGGLCVGMQTASVTKELGMGWYYSGKLLQGIISMILAATVYLLSDHTAAKGLLPLFPAMILVFAAVFIVFFKRKKKVVAISR